MFKHYKSDHQFHSYLKYCCWMVGDTVDIRRIFSLYHEGMPLESENKNHGFLVTKKKCIRHQ